MLLLAKDREISDLHQANKDVHDDLAQHKARLRKVETEKQILLQDITHLNDEIDAKNSALKKLNDDMVKAQKTIKVQSDQIAGVKDGPKPHSTPQRYGPPTSAFSQVYSQPPPAFNAPGNRFNPAESTAVIPYSTPGLRRKPSAQSTFHPQPTYGGALSTLNQGRAVVTPTPTPSYNPFQAQPGVLVRSRAEQASSSVNLLADFTPFFQTTEAWTRNYLRIPDHHKDHFISDSLRACLSLATDPRTAMKLMFDPQTRHLLLARVINQIIADFAFRPMLLRGFTPYYDSKISSFRSRLLGAIPSSVRRGLLQACSETVLDMRQSENFNAFLSATAAAHAHDTWQLLSPLFADGTPRDPAWNDLNRIWQEATRIGSLMLSKPCIFTLDFPPMGPNSYFNPSNMCSRDEGFTRDVTALSSMSLWVRLAITPVVTETDFMKDPIEAKCLHQADVLLSF